MKEDNLDLITALDEMIDSYLERSGYLPIEIVMSSKTQEKIKKQLSDLLDDFELGVGCQNLSRYRGINIRLNETEPCFTVR
jgi:hypothetical protein